MGGRGILDAPAKRFPILLQSRHSALTSRESCPRNFSSKIFVGCRCNSSLEPRRRFPQLHPRGSCCMQQIESADACEVYSAD